MRATTRKNIWIKIAFDVLLIAILIVAVVLLSHSTGKAAPNEVPHIVSLDKGVTVYWPGHPEKHTGELTLKNPYTQKHLTIPLNYMGFGPAMGEGVYQSEVTIPWSDGVYVLEKGVIFLTPENPQEIAGIPTIVWLYADHLYIPNLSVNKYR